MVKSLLGEYYKLCRNSLLYILNYFRDFCELKTAKHDIKQYEIFAKNHLDQRNARVVVMWAKDCNFDINDQRLAQWTFRKFYGQRIIIVNCDCKTLVWHFPKEWKEYFVIVRPNVGYDWGALKLIVHLLEDRLPDTLSVVNNSFYTKWSTPSWIFDQERLCKSYNGIAGCIESQFPQRHLQSFSLSFSKNSLEKGVLSWLQSMPLLNRKSAVVRYFEVGISKVTEKKSIPLIPVLSTSNLKTFAISNWAKSLGDFAEYDFYEKTHFLIINDLSINPTHHLWRFILELNIPLIKRNLLGANPLNIPDIHFGLKIVNRWNSE